MGSLGTNVSTCLLSRVKVVIANYAESGETLKAFKAKKDWKKYGAWQSPVIIYLLNLRITIKNPAAVS